MPLKPNTAMILGHADVHLLGKILDQVDDEMLKDLGFTALERVRADALYDDVERHLNRVVGFAWNDVEVE